MNCPKFLCCQKTQLDSLGVKPLKAKVVKPNHENTNLEVEFFLKLFYVEYIEYIVSII